MAAAFWRGEFEELSVQCDGVLQDMARTEEKARDQQRRIGALGNANLSFDIVRDSAWDIVCDIVRALAAR